METRKTTKLDLHIHTRGSDGWGTPEEIVKAALDAGLDGIAVCDHHSTYTIEGLAVLRAARKAGLVAIAGCEYSCAEGHLLVFGYCVRDACFGFYPPMQDVIDKVTRAGGVAIPAHPYREVGGHVLNDGVMTLKHIRAHETCNGHAALRNPRRNELARAAAKTTRRQGTGGSDAHMSSEVGLCYTVFQGRIANEAQFLRALKRGQYHGEVAQRRLDRVLTERSRWAATTRDPKASYQPVLLPRSNGGVTISPAFGECDDLGFWNDLLTNADDRLLN